jgi:plasmid stabilization system protein ParE
VTSYRLVIQREADSELTEAAQWYEERRRGLGGEFLDEYAELTARLRRNPYLFARILGEARRALFHRFPYSLIYEIHDREVVILACFHEHRDPKEWQRRL